MKAALFHEGRPSLSVEDMADPALLPGLRSHRGARLFHIPLDRRDNRCADGHAPAVSLRAGHGHGGPSHRRRR